jgi:RNA polymerase sigma-B factor
MRFVEGLTQSEIAAAVGVSQMHVSRLLSASLQKLRDGIGQTEAGRR